MFRYLSVGHASTPLLRSRFTESSVPKDRLVVLVRITPLVVLPFGFLVARANLMPASATKPLHTEGTLLLSVFFARKSRLSTAIWLSIWAFEIFSASVR